MLIIGAVAGLAVAEGRVNIGSVATSDPAPQPGESLTVTSTINNLESSDGPVEITNVYLRRASRSTPASRTSARSASAGR